MVSSVCLWSVLISDPYLTLWLIHGGSYWSNCQSLPCLLNNAFYFCLSGKCHKSRYFACSVSTSSTSNSINAWRINRLINSKEILNVINLFPPDFRNVHWRFQAWLILIAHSKRCQMDSKWRNRFCSLLHLARFVQIMERLTNCPYYLKHVSFPISPLFSDPECRV